MAELSAPLEDKIRRLADLRMKRLTYDECAQQMQVSIRTLKRWAALPEFTRIWREIEDEWRSSSQAQVYDAGQLAIRTMISIMENSRSDYAKVTAAKAIGDWAGLGKTEDASAKDDREEMLAALAAIRQRQLATTVVINEAPALPAGDVIEGETCEIQ